MKAGQVFKNQKELCEYIGIEYKDSTNSRKAQLKEFDIRFKWHKEGRKIVIDEIFSELKEKVDNRKGNSGKSEGSRGNNIVYGKYVDVILVQHFFSMLMNGKNVLYTTANQLAEICGIINHNYRAASNNKYNFFQYLIGVNQDINAMAMNDVFDCIKTSVRSIIDSSLKRLARQQYIVYHKTYLIYYHHNVRVPNPHELEILENIENQVCEEMGITKKSELQYNSKLRDEYYKNVEELAKQEIKSLDYVFVGYKINIFFKDDKVEDTTEHREFLNFLIVIKTRQRISRINEVNESKYEEIFAPFNYIPPKYMLERLHTNYISYTDIVINFILNLEAKNISGEIAKEITV